ncbi:hypothetical protein [Bradyrhizobium sp. B117]|uniref:hypothetical protein n=1 Tax=Bradyrhizobium sp. B117 TaxID=3140246 RepID=UPI0031833B0C
MELLQGYLTSSVSSTTLFSVALRGTKSVTPAALQPGGLIEKIRRDQVVHFFVAGLDEGTERLANLGRRCAPVTIFPWPTEIGDLTSC